MKNKVLSLHLLVHYQAAHGRAFFEVVKSICYPHEGRGGNNSPKVRTFEVCISTTFAETPWSTGELAVLHGCSGPRAKFSQERLDHVVCRLIAPMYVKRQVRPDQAANSIRCHIKRLNRMFEEDEANTMKHVTRLVEVAGDRSQA